MRASLAGGLEPALQCERDNKRHQAEARDQKTSVMPLSKEPGPIVVENMISASSIDINFKSF